MTEFNIVIRLIAFSLTGLILGFVLEKYLLKRVGALVSRTGTRLDDVLVNSLRGIVTFLLILAGFSLSVNLFGGPYVAQYRINSVNLSLFILSITILSARIFTQLIKHRTLDSSEKRPSTSIILNITRIAIFLIGAMLIMQVFGISITPILTALGVGGLAVALALQETLSNLFSGIQLLASRNIRKGDYVRLNSGENGYVKDITWRNMIIRELPNNLIVVPNNKVSSAIITNYHLPDPELSVLVEVSVSYSSQLEEVEKLTIKVAKDIQHSTEGAVKEHEPFIRYHTFADSGINFSVILRGSEFTTQYLIKHEFMKALHKAYLENRIEIPVPQRDILIKNFNTPLN